MSYDFSGFKRAKEGAFEWLKNEYTGIRSGRATPSILDSVRVDAYGSQVPINQVASILGAGPKSLLITPWDKSVAPSIDKAIRESNLGLSISMDDQGVRVNFPDLTDDRRNMLVKLTKEKFEEARVRIRNEREKMLGDIDRREKEDSISEDEKFRLRAELQKLVDEANKNLEELAGKKEKDILE